jgi:hypothetical protein
MSGVDSDEEDALPVTSKAKCAKKGKGVAPGRASVGTDKGKGKAVFDFDEGEAVSSGGSDDDEEIFYAPPPEPDNVDDLDFIMGDAHSESASDKDTSKPSAAATNILSVTAAPPLWTNKGVIAWEKVKNKDYIISTIGDRKPADGYHYIIRCESSPGKNTHHFTKNPWRGESHVTRHLNKPSGTGCHDAEYGKELAGKTQREVQKELGYESMRPVIKTALTLTHFDGFSSDATLYPHGRGKGSER